MEKVNVAKFVYGFLEGLVDFEDNEDLSMCLGDTEKTAVQLEKAYNDFKTRTAKGTANGLADLGHALEDLGATVNDCKNIKDIWPKIEKIA
jgi:uncharacterized SAM-dependent methyltransferase